MKSLLLCLSSFHMQPILYEKTITFIVQIYQ